MSQYANLKATIALNVYENHENEVTANKVKAAMNAMTDSLGAGYQYLGIATPATAPGTPDQRVFYIAAQPGTYTNFSGLVVNDGEVAVLKWDTAWHKEVTGAATAAQVNELGQQLDNRIDAEVSSINDRIDAEVESLEENISIVSENLNGRIDDQNQEIDEFEQTVSNQVDNYRPIGITGDVTNAPDEEDITTDANNLLKFKNRNNLFSNLGYFILRRNKTFVEQVTLANTIYEIRYDFDLGGASVTIPAGCILKFVGGSISGGTVELHDCYIDGDAHFENVTFSGSIKNGMFNVLWIDASDLGAAINIAGQYFRNLYLPAGDYEFSTPISISDAGIVKFYGSLTYTGAASNLGAAITFTEPNRADVYLYRLTSDTTIDYTDTRTIHFIGINFVNAVTSRIEIRDVQKFNELVRFSGIDAGCGYNTIYLGLLWHYNFALRVYQEGSGWCNSNKVIGFRCAKNTGINTQHFCAIGGPALDLDSYRDQAATTTYDASSDWSFTNGCFEGVPYPFYSRTLTGCYIAACREENCTGLFKVMYNASIINLCYVQCYKNILGGSDVSLAQRFEYDYSTYLLKDFSIKIGRKWTHTTDAITVNNDVKLTYITSTNIANSLNSLTNGNVGALFEISSKFMTVFLKQAVEKALVVAFYDAEFNNVTNLVEAAYTNDLFGMSINAARNCYAVATRSNHYHFIPALFKASAYGAKYIFVGVQASNTEQNTELIINYNSSPIVDVLPIRGDSASRPANGLPTGQSYYDTSLNPPRPIWWDGTKWIDAAGASV